MSTIKQGIFTDFTNSHRTHQKEAIASLETADIGQVSIPTGTGKTRIQIHAHVKDMIEKSDKGETGVYLIAAHRLALCRQLLQELVDLVAAIGLPFDILFVGSDKIDEDALYEKQMINGITKATCYVTATTKQAEVLKAVDDAKKANRHVILVSTYHSIERLALLNRIDIATYDEAHTIASSRQSDDNFESSIKRLQDKGMIKRQYFFTATRKVSGDDYGMNNEDIYGEVLYEASPGKMIREGEIVQPRIHRVSTVDDGQFKNETMIIKTIMDVFTRHKKAVRDASSLAGNLGAKLLISAEGTPEVRKIVNNNNLKAWCLRNKIRLFVFSSILGNYMFNSEWKFEKASRNSVVDEMQGMDDAQDAILIHIDILSEGIDLPSITGVMPFRELNLIKLLQTIGRGARLLRGDRKNFYKGITKPLDFDKMVKPYCWVIFPLLSDKTSEASKKMKRTIETVVAAYDAPKMQFNREDEYIGDPDPDISPITPRDASTKVDPTTNLNHWLEQLMINPEVVDGHTLSKSLGEVADPKLIL